MNAHTADKKILRPPETGWAIAHQGRGRDMRTCVSPFGQDRRSPASSDTSAEGNIVRGDD